jgi:hypothetical protein
VNKTSFSPCCPPACQHLLISCFLFFVFNGTGVCAYKVGALRLKPPLQSVLLWLFWRWGLVTPDGPRALNLPLSTSQATRIIGMSHQHPAIVLFSWNILSGVRWNLNVVLMAEGVEYFFMYLLYFFWKVSFQLIWPFIDWTTCYLGVYGVFLILY